MKFSEALKLLEKNWGIYRESTKEELIGPKNTLYLNEKTEEMFLPIESINATDWKAQQIFKNDGNLISLNIEAGYENIYIAGDSLKDVLIYTNRYSVKNALIDISEFTIRFNEKFKSPYSDMEKWLKDDGVPIRLRARIHRISHKTGEQIIVLYTVDDLKNMFPKKDEFKFKCLSTAIIENGEVVF